MLAAALPSSNEQYMVELLNRARANPTAEASRYGIALNEGLAAGTISTAAKQPLAINPYLTDAARKHSQWMIDTDTFSHTGANGTNPQQRMVNAGYTFSGAWGYGENIAWRGSTGGTPPVTSTVGQEHRDLFVDANVPGRGHRLNIENPSFREVGVGVATGNFRGYNAVMAAQDFAYSGSGSFLTGVAYNDTVTWDNFYTPGEGLSGITVRATRTSDNAAFSTTTWPSGGYRLKLSPATYTVTASGTALGGTLSLGSVTIGSLNVKRDIRPSVRGGTTGEITGTVFNDRNANGARDEGERPLARRRVFIDKDSDGIFEPGEKSARTDAAGNYTLKGLQVGTYRVRQVVPAGWRRTAPGRGYHAVTIGSASAVGGFDFGNTRKALITGRVFHDADADGRYDRKEAGLAGRRVYLDLDGDGRFDENEPSRLTAPDGRYRFAAVAPGTYRVRAAAQSGWARTSPPLGTHAVTLSAAGAATGLNFGARRLA